MKVLLLLAAAAVCSAVVVDKAVGGSFSPSGSTNALPGPPPRPQDLSLPSQYGPPPQSSGPNIQYGPPPQLPPTFTYGPPPPPPPPTSGSPFSLKKNKFQVYNK